MVYERQKWGRYDERGGGKELEIVEGEKTMFRIFEEVIYFNQKKIKGIIFLAHFGLFGTCYQWLS